MNTNIKIAIEELHKAFYLLNEALYENQLPEPAILIQNRGNKKNVLGWCSTKEIWVNSITKDTKYEINIVAERLNRPLFELMGTLIHEMAHLYNLINDIKDVSRNGTYHNKLFKKTAEEHGLIITHDKRLGWSLTTLQEYTKELIMSFELNEEAFSIVRVDQLSEGDGKSKSSSRKYICPGCGTIIRSSKDVSVFCGVCRIAFIKQE